MPKSSKTPARVSSPSGARRTTPSSAWGRVVGLLGVASMALGVALPAEAAEAPRLGCAANGITPEWGVNWGTQLLADETWEHVDGDPLLIGVGSRGSTAVYVCQPSPMNIKNQYYGGYNWGTKVWLAGTDTARAYGNRYGLGTRFVAENQTVATSGTETTVTTSMLLGSEARLTQIISYHAGAYVYKIRWELTNLTGNAFNDVRLFHGGDAYFGGDDSARSWWNPTQNMVYLNNSSFLTSGIMGFYGSAATPATHYFGGNYSTGNTQAKTTARLDDTTSSTSPFKVARARNLSRNLSGSPPLP